MTLPRVVIVGLRGGSGKTTLSIGLTRALREKGIRVTPFKKGPDYIDAGWLASSAGKPCYNLDPFLIGQEKVLASFIEHFGDTDCAVIEGNRGLFDGMDVKGSCSTAKVSKILKSPVILIVDCTKITRTLAAMVLGVKRFDPGLKLAGVVLNQIAGKRHETVIRESIQKYCKVPVLGAIPRFSEMQLPERHMGLTPFQEYPEVDEAISRTAGIIKRYVDLDRVLKIAKSAPTLKPSKGVTTSQVERGFMTPVAGDRCLLGIIRDSAFQFYYPENFEELEKQGVELIEISALTESRLPDIDALYIGGGFPETHAIALSENTGFRKSLRKAVEKGLPVYAECGGLMYLGKSLVVEGKAYPMAGVFPVSFTLEKKPQAHGYTVVKVTGANPFFKRGTVLRGHEFHYSKVTTNKHLIKSDKKGAVPPCDKELVTFAFKMQRGEGIAGGKDGLCYKNVFATYTHLHALGAPEWVKGMIKAARADR